MEITIKEVKMENHNDDNYPKFTDFITVEEMEMVMDYQDSIFLSELLKMLPKPDTNTIENK